MLFCALLGLRCANDYSTPLDGLDEEEKTWLRDYDGDGTADSLEKYAAGCAEKLEECYHLARLNFDRDKNVSAPEFSPAPGTFSKSQQVAITTKTSGAVVRYTVNGQDPTAGSTLYVGPVSITANTVLKAIAYKDAAMPTAVVDGTYRFKPAAPSVSPDAGTYAESKPVVLATQSGGVIRFTLDGSQPDSQSTAYGSPIVVDTTTTVKAAVFVPGWDPGEVVTVAYVISKPVPLEAPVFSPPGGTYASARNVTLSASAGAEIRYTTNGGDPGASSSLYAAAISVAVNTRLKARAFKAGQNPGPVATADYVFKAGPPDYSPPPGSYPEAQGVLLSTTMAGGTVRYTVDGSTPTDSSTAASPTSPILVFSTVTIKAAVFVNGWDAGETVSLTYTIN